MNKNYKSNEKNDCSSPKDNTQKFKILNLLYKIFVALGIVAIILLIIFKPCDCKCDCAKSTSQSTYFDTTVDDSVSDEKTESAVADLNQQVEDGMITMSMNADPSFDNGSAKGNLLIENDKINKHPQVVQIYRNDTKELIYTSSMIPVGQFINDDTLDVKLPKGDYKCTAYFNAVDENTGEKLGTSGANITIHILN
ncbi:MAG: hypothetical protein ACI4F6_08995 [Acutalibacteraceae bacterium]